ncbi:hypothetical protein BN2475_380126 [Paraburkholderia ribeironis]|uniref:Uncharacterized protein n=1 Tax=Paraburkholderia ribeironis TaxID=1247936 RepID=A0A1N7S690_9BURK|nr:hypothetical protein BN2475_380126 [Paraburkholderia ribeironis]
MGELTVGFTLWAAHGQARRHGVMALRGRTALAEVRLGVLVDVGAYKQFGWREPEILAVLVEPSDRCRAGQRQRIGKHDVMRRHVRLGREVIAVVVFEHTFEPRGRACQIREAQFGVGNARERGVECFVFLNAAARHEPGAARRAVAAMAEQDAPVGIADDQIDRDQWCQTHYVKKIALGQHEFSSRSGADQARNVPRAMRGVWIDALGILMMLVIPCEPVRHVCQ